MNAAIQIRSPCLIYNEYKSIKYQDAHIPAVSCFGSNVCLLSLSLLLVMDTKAVFAALYSVCEENAAFFSGGAKGSQGDAARRLVDVMKLIQEHAHNLEPVISSFASVYHYFDFDPHIPANGYRSLVKVIFWMLSRLFFFADTPAAPALEWANSLSVTAL